MTSIQKRLYNIVLVLLVGGPLLFCGCSFGGSSEESSDKRGAEILKETRSTFSLLGHTEEGRKKWKVEGQTHDLLAPIVHLAPIDAYTYGEMGTHLKADQGQFQREKQAISLWGNVVLTTTDNVVLSAQSFDWVPERRVGTTLDWVEVERERLMISGHGATVLPDEKRVFFDKDVTLVIVNPEEDRETTVTSLGAFEINYLAQTGRFWDRVRVDDKKGWILSDRLDVIFDKQTQQLLKAIFIGNVEIHHGPQIAYARKAIYWQKDGRVQLIGRPKLKAQAEDRGLPF